MTNLYLGFRKLEEAVNIITVLRKQPTKVAYITIEVSVVRRS